MNISLGFLATPLALLVACAGPEATSEPDPGKLQPPVSPGGSAPTPTLVQTAPQDGTTNAGTAPTVTFGGTAVYKENVDFVVSELGQRAAFISAGGQVVGAVVTAEVNTDPYDPFEFNFRVVPAAELQPDTWYRFRVSAGRTRTIDVENEERPAGYSLSFFTTGAPRIARAILSAKSPTHLRIELSEPVELGTLVAGLALSADGAVAKGCITWMGACATADSPIMNAAADYSFDVPPKSLTPALSLSLSDVVLGSSRTVGEARAALPAQASRDLLDPVEIAPSSWRTSGDGSVWERTSAIEE